MQSGKEKKIIFPSLPLRGGAPLWVVSLPRARWAGGRKVLGGAAGCSPGAAGERDAGSQEDGVPLTGNSG